MRHCRPEGLSQSPARKSRGDRCCAPHHVHFQRSNLHRFPAAPAMGAAPLPRMPRTCAQARGSHVRSAMSLSSLLDGGPAPGPPAEVPPLPRQPPRAARTRGHRTPCTDNTSTHLHTRAHSAFGSHMTHVSPTPNRTHASRHLEHAPPATQCPCTPLVRVSPHIDHSVHSAHQRQKALNTAHTIHLSAAPTQHTRYKHHVFCRDDASHSHPHTTTHRSLLAQMTCMHSTLHRTRNRFLNL